MTMRIDFIVNVILSYVPFSSITITTVLWHSGRTISRHVSRNTATSYDGKMPNLQVLNMKCLQIRCTLFLV